MDGRRLAVLLVVAGSLALAGVVVAEYLHAPTGDGVPPGDDRAVVTLYDGNGTELGVVRAHLADTPEERYAGLSPFESLANGSGMLFVFPEEGRQTFVMRRMDFPLDMVFVGSDGRITTLHHAPVPPEGTDDLERYPGRAQWVLEVPRGWTTAHGVDVGDRIEIDYPANATLTPTAAG